jgi:hypothetical protein
MTRFLNFTSFAIAASTVFAAIPASSQQTSPASSRVSARADAILASFNKKKDVVKERRGVRVEKYKQVRTIAAPPVVPRDYSGTYRVEGLGSSLDLSIDNSGNVSGRGTDAIDADASVFRRFTLSNGRLEGAMLTATKVYENGSTSALEGVFVNSTSYESRTDAGRRTFGLAVLGPSVTVGGVTTDKFLFQRRQ